MHVGAHLTLFAHAAILSTLRGSGSRGSLLRVQMLQGRTSVDLTADLGSVYCGPCHDHPRALLDEVCIMGRVLSLKDESMWHEEENFHPISHPDYPTTYSSLIACCVS